MATEFQNKLNSALRYGATATATGLTFFAAISILTPDQVAELKAQIEILNQSILTAYGALTKMWIIAGPVAVGVAAKLGWNSSGVQALANKLFSIAANKADPASTQASVAIVNAAAAKEVAGEGAAVIAPAIATNPATAENVVASAEAVKS